MLPRIAGVFGLGLLLGYKNFDRLSGVDTASFDSEEFPDKSIGGTEVNWPKTITDDSAPNIKAIEQFHRNDEAQFKFAEKVAVQKRPRYGLSHYLRGKLGHAYTYTSNPIDVPELFQPIFADNKSNLPARGMLSMFAPHAGEVPNIVRISDFEDSSDIGGNLIQQFNRESERDSAIVDLRSKRMRENAPVEGDVALGNAYVRASGSRIIENERFVIRSIMMSTSEVHPLDGRALWMQIYDKADKTATFCAVGAGRNSSNFMDRMNDKTAGHVFSVMHNSFGRAMRFAAKQGGVPKITDAITPEGWSLTGDLMSSSFQDLDHDDQVLLARRSMATTFDSQARTFAMLRMIRGMEITDVTSEDDDILGVLAKVKDDSDM